MGGNRLYKGGNRSLWEEICLKQTSATDNNGERGEEGREREVEREREEEVDREREVERVRERQR